jgi:hypothetical protein
LSPRSRWNLWIRASCAPRPPGGIASSIIANRTAFRIRGRLDPAIRPSLTRGRTEFRYEGTLTRIPEGAAPDVKNKSFRITANLVLPKGDEHGIVLTQGGLSAGYALLFNDGKFDETFDVGEDTGTPVSENYDVPFKFTGQIQKLIVDLGQK